MANFALTDWVSSKGQLETVMAAMEVQLETVDTTKTVVVANIYQLSDNQFQAALLYEV